MIDRSEVQLGGPMSPTAAPFPSTPSPLSVRGQAVLANLEHALRRAGRVLSDLVVLAGQRATPDEETQVAHAEVITGAVDQVVRVLVREEVYKECERGNAAIAPGQHRTYNFKEESWLAPSRRMTRVVNRDAGQVSFRWRYVIYLDTIGPDGEPETKEGTERYAFDAFAAADVEEALTRSSVREAIMDAVAVAVVEGDRTSSWDDFLITVPMLISAEKAVQGALHQALIESRVLPALRTPGPGEPSRFIDPDDRVELVDMQNESGRMSARIVVTPANS